ncbi:hypothetical protein ACIBI4_19725 [Streptomyces sp. NPDC050418]|uniref:hypothetical protein n=1 Tax=Streptomyces sp. NPDC050418 TaxID=3365612 RepID=UPI0037A6150F
MKLAKRAGLAVAMTCIASAAAVSPALADSAPVPVPLDGLENALGSDLPDVRGGVPLIMPGDVSAPRIDPEHLQLEGVVPQVPLRTALPQTLVDAPLTDPLSNERLAGAAFSVPDIPVDATSPGASVGAPQVRQRPSGARLPELPLPQAALLQPTLQTAPSADALLS